MNPLIASCPRSMDTVVRRCQAVAASAADGRHHELSHQLRELALNVSGDVSVAERLIIHRVLTRTCACAAKVVGVHRHPDIAARLVEAASMDISQATWRRVLEALAASCADAVDVAIEGNTNRSSDPRVERVLHVIAARCVDVTLSLPDIAADTGISMFHLARLVKRSTGHSVAAHIHRSRVALSRNLLQRASLSIKEIAAAVGYDSSTQFGRHFKRLEGMTPRAFRRRAHAIDSGCARIDEQ
jgi:AraC-like DNA-binding protein